MRAISIPPEALARALTDRSGIPVAPARRPSAAYTAPVYVRPAPISETLAAENNAGLRRFEMMAYAGAMREEDEGGDAAAYLRSQVKTLVGYLAALDAPCGETPRHLRGVDASDLALCRDRLLVRAERVAL